MPDTSINSYMTIAQVMKTLGCSEAMVRKLCRAGELRHFRLGVAYRIYPDSVDDYIARNTHGGLES